MWTCLSWKVEGRKENAAHSPMAASSPVKVSVSPRKWPVSSGCLQLGRLSWLPTWALPATLQAGRCDGAASSSAVVGWQESLYLPKVTHETNPSWPWWWTSCRSWSSRTPGSCTVGAGVLFLLGAPIPRSAPPGTRDESLKGVFTVNQVSVSGTSERLWSASGCGCVCVCVCVRERESERERERERERGRERRL